MATNKALGQHWLRNRGILDEIAGLAAGDFADGIEHGSTEKTQALNMACLEIGPGLGTLTAALLRRFMKVIAVEYDGDLARKLPGSFPGKDLTVVNEDFLRFDLSQVPAPYVVAGNIPYYITSPIIERLLMAENQPTRVVLLMQKEVAERICDTERESLLSLRCKNRAKVWLGIEVPREEFEPAPKVDSAVVVFEPHTPEVGDEVMRLIERGFAQPRKKLAHNLAGVVMQGADGATRTLGREQWAEILVTNGVSPDARPADLGLPEWQRVYDRASVVVGVTQKISG